MTKVKYLVIGLIVFLLMIIPNTSKAASDYTYSDTEQGIEWGYDLDDSGNVINLICKTTTINGEVTIPSSIDGKNVISLGERWGNGGAFEGQKGITKITMPNTITSMGEETFYECSGLRTIKLSDNLSSIGPRAFYSCTGLTAIDLPDNLSSIESSAFQGCTGLTAIDLPNKISQIERSAFYSCTGLKSLVLPNSITTLGNYAFYNCSGLKELTLSENLTTISDYCFEGCSGLTSVVIPNNVTTISYQAFSYCKNLEKILIPDTVATIGNSAFYDCDKLTIYGHDGMASKTYAEANKINFDYIENWDKSNIGDDVTAPTVKSIEISYSSVLNYYTNSMFMVPTGANLVINANFSENISGTTAPTLTIKFGEGDNIQLKNGTIVGSKVAYTYKIKDTDKGTMTAVSFSGGDIKDLAGNQAKLSCPGLRIEYWSEAYVYANGDASKPNNNTGNQNGGTTGTAGSNDKKDSNNKNGSNGKDTTVASGVLPYTGTEIAIVFFIILLAGGSIVVYTRYKKLRDIK